MVTFVIIAILAIVLLLGIVYFFLHQSPEKDRRPSRHDPVQPVKKEPSAGSDDQRGGAPPPVLPHDETAEEEQSLQVRLAAGMERVFTVAEPPVAGEAAMNSIDDVHADVREKVLAHVGALKNIDTLHKLQRMVGDPQAAMAELSRMITADPMLTAKVLRVANSPYYGMEQKLNSISHAIMIIGFANLKGIIYSQGILNVLNEKSFQRDPAMQALWRHANYTAICSSYLGYLFRGLNQGTLFTLGILHDIGKFLLMKLPPLAQHDSQATVSYSPSWTLKEEEAVYGVNHTVVGRLALQHWGLSELMVQTVGLHHAPACLDRKELKLDREALQYLLVLFLANQAACLIGGEYDGADPGKGTCEYLHPSYHDQIDRKELRQLFLDRSLMAQLREAEAINRTSV